MGSPPTFLFTEKKIVWKFFQSTTALQHKFTPYFYSSKNSVTLVVTYYNISWKQPPPKLLLRKKNLFTSVTVVTFLRRYVPIQEARRKNTKKPIFFWSILNVQKSQQPNNNWQEKIRANHRVDFFHLWHFHLINQ